VEDERDLLRHVGELAASYVASLGDRPVRPTATLEALRRSLGGPVPEEPSPPIDVVDALARDMEPGLMAMGSGRFFGFVIGGALPAALGADWLTSAWDQNAGLALPTPAAAVVEEVTAEWLCDLLGLPTHASVGFVTGCQMAHVTCLAAARHHLLAASGWDVETDGLAGAPRIRVVTGACRHSTVDRALRFLGIGTAALRAVEVDDQGRIIPAALREELSAGSGPTIVVAQAGEVNTGSFDPLDAIADTVAQTGGWLHVDGAFGLWAAASPRHRHLVTGVERADSWATDAHKWLNVPYDSGLAFCAHPRSHQAAMTVRAPYLLQTEPGTAREPVDWNPEFSRRARGIAVYAAIRQLGRAGIADLIDRCCAHAASLAAGVSRIPGCSVVNDVVLNQVLVRFDDDATTGEVLRRLQEEGEIWLSGTTWHDRFAIRVSVSNWRTTTEDIARTVAAFDRAAAATPG
jgi:glutamate/tyrosine decarboxylase-like PLP-dependent enzyme